MMRLVGRMARGIISAAITLAVVVGGPWALVHFFGSPIPTSVPDGDAVSRWVNDPLSSTNLRGVVMVVLWLAWAVFVWILTVETYAAIRRIRAPRIRLAAPLHGVAAGLVGATATAMTGGVGHAAPPATATGNVATAEMPDLISGTGGAAGAAASYQDADAAPSSVASTRYRVVAGDWMVGVADRFLGDPDAYTRLVALNPQLAEDPRFPDHIEPGWEIILPADAVDRGPRLHATGTVNAVPPPVDDTPVTTPPDPVDQSGDVTAEPTPPPGPSATATPAPSVGSTYPYYPDDDDEVPDDEDADRIVAGLDNGSGHIGAMSGAGLLASMVLLALQAERRRQTQYRRPGQRLPNPRGGQTERELRVVEAPADVERLDLALRHLAAALVDHPRQPDILGVRVIGGDVQLLLGKDCEAPPEPWLDEGSHWVLPGDVPLMDLPGHARPLPSLTAVGSRAGRHLLLDLERHGVLSIVGDRVRAKDLLRYMVCELACSTWSEYSEITIAGFNDTESGLLRELNWHRVRIAVDVTDAIGQLRRHITATRQALDALNLTDTVAGRIQQVATDAWTPHILLVANASLDDQTRAELTALHHELVATGRCAVAAIVVTADAAPIGPAVTVAEDGLLTIAAPPLRTTTGAARLPAAELDKLAEILRLARATELDIAAEDDDRSPTTDTAHQDETPREQLVDEEPTEADPIDGTAVISGLYDPTTWSQPRPDPTGGTSTTPHREPTPSRPTPTPGDALDADLHHWHTQDTARPRIAVLGPVSVTAFGKPLEARTPFHTEIVVYLATHSRGADRYQLEEAFWPDKEIGQASLKVAMARTRSWLGAEWLEDANRTRIYRLTPGFLFDWSLFRQLTARAKARGRLGVDDRRAALELVRGRALHGADVQTTGRKPYTWLANSAIDPTHLVAVVVDAAHELAEDYLATGDTGGIRWAVSQAWAADPDRGHDEPWIDLMKAERLDGHRNELRHLVDQLKLARDAEVLEDLAPATYREVTKVLRD